MNANTATVVAPDVPTQHPDRAIQSIGDMGMTGGGPVNSSSMETSTRPSSLPVQSTINSAHNLDHTPMQNRMYIRQVVFNHQQPRGHIHTPNTSLPPSAISWLRRLSPPSPTLTTTNNARLEKMLVEAESAIRAVEANDALIKPASPSSDVTDCPEGDRTHSLAREGKRQLTRHNKQATDDKRQFVIPK